MPAHGSTDAEVERSDQRSILLDLLAFKTDLGDPVLSAGVGAAGDVELDLLVEGGKALFHLGDEPACEALSLRDGELAKFGTSAGDDWARWE